MPDIQEPIPQPPVSKVKKYLPDATVDGIAVVALITIVVTAVVYWLISLPEAY